MMGLDECLLGGECSCGSEQQDSFLELHSLSLMLAACCSYVCKKENISELSKKCILQLRSYSLLHCFCGSWLECPG